MLAPSEYKRSQIGILESTGARGRRGGAGGGAAAACEVVLNGALAGAAADGLVPAVGRVRAADDAGVGLEGPFCCVGTAGFRHNGDELVLAVVLDAAYGET